MTRLAVDFSRASGADLPPAMIGKYAEPGTDARSAQGTTAKFHAVEACGYSRIVLLTVQSGEPPAPRVEGDAIAADILKAFPEGPYAIRASAVLRKASDALLNLE